MTLAIAFGLLAVFAAALIYCTVAIIVFTEGRDDGRLDVEYPATSSPLGADVIGEIYGAHAWFYQCGYKEGRRAAAETHF